MDDAALLAMAEEVDHQVGGSLGCGWGFFVWLAGGSVGWF